MDNLTSKAISKVSSIKTFDFSTFYTTILFEQFKSRLWPYKSTFNCKNGSRRYNTAVFNEADFV